MTTFGMLPGGQVSCTLSINEGGSGDKLRNLVLLKLTVLEAIGVLFWKELRGQLSSDEAGVRKHLTKEGNIVRHT